MLVVWLRMQIGRRSLRPQREKAKSSQDGRRQAASRAQNCNRTSLNLLMKYTKPAAISSHPSLDRSTNKCNYLAGWIAYQGDQARYCHRWLPCQPSSSIQHVCVLIHGLGDHGGRYDQFGRFLASRSIALQVIDLVGHGRSPGKRGRADSYQALLDEVQFSLSQAQMQWRNAAITLAGQSMGGNLALAYQLAQSASRSASNENDRPNVLPLYPIPEVQSLTLLAPMLVPAGRPIRDDFLAAGQWLAKRFPNWPMRSASKVEMLTALPENQHAYRCDRLVHRTMSVRLGIDLVLGGRQCLAAAAELDTPTLILHGTDDRLSDLAASEQLASRSKLVELVRVNDGLHELLNDVASRQIMQQLGNWIVEGELSDRRISEKLAAAA